MKNISIFIPILFVFISINSFSQNSLNSFTDNRDGRTYKTVTIANQIWMAENLAYKVEKGCWVFDNKKKNALTHGCLYTWEIAKDICPEGWHLPSQNEYDILLSTVGGEGINSYNSLIKGGSSGFSAALGGWRSNYGAFNYIDYYGGFWSSTQCSKETALYMSITTHNTRAYIRNFDSKVQGYSVRCVKD